MDSEAANKQLVSFCGEIIEATVADRPSAADDWVQNILRKHNHQEIIVGLDCKFTSSHPIRSMNEKIATLQLCVDTKCLVLQLSYMESIPESVKSFLADPNVSFFGVEVHDRVLKLQRDYGINCRSKITDVRALIKIMLRVSYREEPSLKAMALKVAGLSLRKRKNGCELEWKSRVLAEELVEYACVDAYACYKIALKLLT